jgi:hypothetical protein
VGACSTTVQPRSSARIGLVIHHGAAFYIKDGQETAVGPLGGDLGGLVVGAPDAVRLARRARDELAVGVPAYLVGIAAAVTGLAVRKPVGWGVFGGGVAVGVTGVVLMGAGFTNAVDAVNAYNDNAGAPDARARP